MKKIKRTHKPSHHRKKAENHELVFALSLAILVSMLGLYAYIQMYTFRVSASGMP